MRALAPHLSDHPDDLQPVRQYLLEALEAPEPTRPVEMRVRHRNGQWRDVEAVGSNQNDNPAVGGIVLNVRDVTERRRAEAELAHSATHDALTGLPNRALFMSRLAHRLQQREARALEPAVMFLDIDRFKMINDSLGHDVGDQLLVEAARRLRAALPPVDTVARFGGDEFVILCEEATDPADLARRLLAVFDKPFRLAGDDYHLSASLGVSYPDRPAAEPAELVRDADTAMYRAKEQGRGRLHMFDEAARAAAVGRAHTEHLLRNAIDRHELRLFYQPIIDMRTGAVVAAEALIRWNHPRLGLIGPEQFIGTAEDSGLIVAIGEWVLDQALAQARIWADRGAAIDMAINVSGRQLNDDDFVTTVDRLIKQYCDPDRASLQVTLEVTESVLIHDPDAIAQRLGQIKQSGVRLSMDDFGTGYSSLSNLRRLPFDNIKIDRLFVGGVTNSFDDGTIVRAIIALAHSLGRTVVAEGVETQEQLDLLRALGCDRAQGYHIGRPAPATPLPHQLRIDRPELPGSADHRTGMVDGARS